MPAASRSRYPIRLKPGVMPGIPPVKLERQGTYVMSSHGSSLAIVAERADEGKRQRRLAL